MKMGIRKVPPPPEDVLDMRHCLPLPTLQGRAIYLKDKTMTQQADIRDRQRKKMTTVAKTKVIHGDE